MIHPIMCLLSWVLIAFVLIGLTMDAWDGHIKARLYVLFNYEEDQGVFDDSYDDF